MADGFSFFFAAALAASTLADGAGVDSSVTAGAAASVVPPHPAKPSAAMVTMARYFFIRLSLAEDLVGGVLRLLSR